MIAAKLRRVVSLSTSALAATFLWNVATAESAAASPATGEPALKTAFTSNSVMNAVTVTDDGRVFVSFPYWGGGKTPGPAVAELDKAGHPTAYPDAAWNDYRRNKDAAHSFVRVNAIRIGPDGNLWVVDSGEANVGGDPTPPGGAKAKLVVIDTKTNHIVKTIPLDAAVTPNSYIDDLRFHGRYLFLTDAGDPALVVVDTASGTQRRVLQHDVSTTDERPMLAEGHILMSGHNQVRVHADQIETSPDGSLLYFQPSSGPLYVVATAALEDASLPPEKLASQVRQFVDTPSTGGTAIDEDGNLYVSDVNRLRILKITPDAHVSVLISDPRLVWADAMWIDSTGKLWIPAIQLNRTASFQPDHVSRLKLPVAIYTMDLHLKPVR